MALSEKEKRFCEEYAADPNAVQAYLRAFPDCTYTTARMASSRLLQKITVKTEVLAARKEHARRCRLDACRIIREIVNIAHADPADVFEEGPNGEPVLRKWKTIRPNARKTILKAKVKRKRLSGGGGIDDNTEWEVEETEVVFHSKADAIDKLCKHLGLTKEGAGLEQLFALLSGSPASDKAAHPAVGESGGDSAQPWAVKPPTETGDGEAVVGADPAGESGTGEQTAGPEPVSQ